jgi:hypothetical protein
MSDDVAGRKPRRVRACPGTEGLTRIGTDETDLRTGKTRSNDEIQGGFAVRLR